MHLISVRFYEMGDKWIYILIHMLVSVECLFKNLKKNYLEKQDKNLKPWMFFFSLFIVFFSGSRFHSSQGLYKRENDLEIMCCMNLLICIYRRKNSKNHIFLGWEINLYSQAIGWLAGWLTWLNKWIALANTQFEFAWFL